MFVLPYSFGPHTQESDENSVMQDSVSPHILLRFQIYLYFKTFPQGSITTPYLQMMVSTIRSCYISHEGDIWVNLFWINPLLCMVKYTCASSKKTYLFAVSQIRKEFASGKGQQFANSKNISIFKFGKSTNCVCVYIENWVIASILMYIWDDLGCSSKM